MQGFLPIPALEAPSDGMAFVFSAPNGRPGWTALTGGSLTGFVAGQVAFGSSTGGLTTDANLSYNAGTGALTLGKTTATHTISSTVASTSAATGALVVAGGVGIGGDVYLAGDGANQGSKLIGSPYGILVRHRGYGYSPSTYTAVQVSQAAHGVGFGVDPLSITGGQFTGDSTDVFFTRNAVIGCPNSGATDWVWGLKIAGGSTSKGSPSVVIGDSSVTIASGFPLTVSDAIKSSAATAGIGYATGAGGTVTQATSKSTGVTLSTVCGTITLNAASLAANASVAFTWTNTAIAATDYIDIQHDSVGTLGAYSICVTPGAGSATVTVRNNTAGALAEAIVLRFFVTKAVTS